MFSTDLNFTRDTWRNWLTQLRSFVLAPRIGRTARMLFALVIAAALATNSLNVVNSYVGRNFMTAIAERDRLGFFTQALMWIGVFAAATVVSVLGRYAEDRLGLVWRTWGTRELLERYMARRTYLKVATLGGIENPDQRISEDVKSFTTVTLSFILMALNGTLTVIAFSTVLWTISPTLFVVGVLYAAFGTVMSLLLGRPLIRLNYQQLDREADFRGALVHVKEHAPLVALAGREAIFSHHLHHRLERLVENAGKVIVVQRNLSFFTTGYNWLIQIIPALIVAPLFIRGEVEFGVITQSAMAFTHLLGAFSLIVTQIQTLSSLAAVVARLDTLINAIVGEHDTGKGIVTEVDETRIVFDQVTMHSAHRHRVLVADLNLEVHPGQNLLIRGGANDVRSVLLRTTAGLRRSGTGRIVRPGPRQLMYVTEQPYLPDGTLLDLLHAGNGDPPLDVGHRDEVLEVLQLVGLESILARCIDVDVDQKWGSLLTVGEQQLLVCARVLLARPRFVMLERLSVTLERATIHRLLAMLREREVTYLVLEPDSDDLAAFELVLQLGESGSWHAERVTRGRADGAVGGAR